MRHGTKTNLYFLNILIPCLLPPVSCRLAELFQCQPERHAHHRIQLGNERRDFGGVLKLEERGRLHCRDAKFPLEIIFDTEQVRSPSREDDSFGLFRLRELLTIGKLALFYFIYYNI